MKTRLKKWISLLFAIVILLGTACKKDNINEPGKPQSVQPLVRPIGTSKGAVVAKVIGTTGGTLLSADGTVTVTIPAGAVTGNTTVGIEPITNTNVAGIGQTAYRLTPHGQTFSKPVAISFSWAEHADSIGFLQTLGLAYQRGDGIWKFVGASSVDANDQTITFQTTHFSDWSLMNQVTLSPYQKDLEPGQSINIEALLFTQTDADDLFVPLVPNSYDEPGYPVGFPQNLPSKYIKQWKLAGPGKISQVAAHEVKYTAPGSVNGYTTAAVSLELKAPASYTGQFQLVSNINIKGGSWVELSVGGGAPVTFPATPVVKMGSRYLLANPEDEGGGYFLLAWNGGVGDHSFDLSNTGTYVHFITPANTYVSHYLPHVDADLKPSGGSVTITRLGDGWVEGSFHATQAGYTDTLIPTTTLKGKFKVQLAQ
jgi:hypothetical protein